PGVAIGPESTQRAVETYFPALGAGFVAVSLFFFAFTTTIAYYYIAETNLSYLDKNAKSKWTVWVLRIVIVAAVFYGSIRTAEIAWAVGDIGVGIMAWLNIVAIFLLRKPAMLALKDYAAQKKLGIDPVFSAKKLGIKNADEWDEN